jgi:hypothetical protein
MQLLNQIKNGIKPDKERDESRFLECLIIWGAPEIGFFPLSHNF